jgi:hypothetical protein
MTRRPVLGRSDQTVNRIATAWADVRDHPLVTKAYRESLRRHWTKVPLLQPHASLI